MNWNTLVSEYLPYLLPALIVLATALMVTLLVLGRRREKRLPPPKLKASEAGVAVGGTASNRRSSLRREGQVVEVLVQSPAFDGGAAAGYVVDRSTGGLRLALAAGMAAGTALQVRAKHAPDTIPWVTVLVRSCRPSDEHFELGCEFEKTPPWNVLLLFG